MNQFVPEMLFLNGELLWGGADGRLAWVREEGIQTAVILTGSVHARSITERVLSVPAVEASFPKPLRYSALLYVLRCTVAITRRRTDTVAPTGDTDR